MMTFKAFKKSLGELGDGLSDEEIDKLRHEHDLLASIMFRTWFDDRMREKREQRKDGRLDTPTEL